jgi:hypothetical protein
VSSVPEQSSFPQQAQGLGIGQGALGAAPDDGQQAYGGVDIEEASRQLDLALHDIAVAATCLGLGDLDEAHTNVITARAAADAAEEILRVALGGELHISP